MQAEEWWEAEEGLVYALLRALAHSPALVLRQLLFFVLPWFILFFSPPVPVFLAFLYTFERHTLDLFSSCLPKSLDRQVSRCWATFSM